MKNSHSAGTDKPANGTIETRDDTNLQFGWFEWLLALGMALTWGSSFLLIDIIIRDAPATFVPFGRSFFGMVALFFVPGSRQKIDRRHQPRLLILGLIWMALPFLLFPLAEQTVASSIAGMMNGALPVVVAIITAIWVRKAPSLQRIFAVVVGFIGIFLIAAPSIRDGGSADVKGIVYLTLALLCYAVGLNIARPLQAIYSPATLMLRVVALSTLLSAPLGIVAMRSTTFSLGMIGATVFLGALGSGFAFLLFGTLLKRTGPVRSMIPTYFTPIVGTFLGVLFNDENILMLSIVGMLIVIFGAWLTSRPEKAITQ
ncbi:MAG: DMT family transporter [Ilumatobacteraceae bacterium]